MKPIFLRLMTLLVVFGLGLGGAVQAQSPGGEPDKLVETFAPGDVGPVQQAPSPQLYDRATLPPEWAPSQGDALPTAPSAKKEAPDLVTPLEITPLATGGPDNYGYRFADNVSATSCNTTFTDISGTGTNLNLNDDDEANVSIPWLFAFYGYIPGSGSTTPLRVGNNGGILWNATSGDVPADNAALYSSSMGPAILPFWDDLYNNGDVYYQTLGTAPNRRFIVQWNNISHIECFLGVWPCWNVGSATFQVVFYEANHGIDFVYQDVDFGDSDYNNGVSATVGIQYNSSNYLQYSYNTASLANGRAICFRNPTAGGERCTEAVTIPMSDTSCPGSVSWLGSPRMDVTGALGTSGGFGGPAASCWLDGTANNDVWYRWTNNTGAPVYVRVTTDMLVNGNQTNGDSQIGVWSGCSAGSGTGQLFCSDDGGDVGNTYLAPSNYATNITVANGATIYLQFDGWNTNTAFDTFAFACAPTSAIAAPPPNDACSAAVAVPNTPYNNGGLNMSGATVVSSDPRATCMFNSGEQRGGGTVWYTYTPAVNGTVTATCKGVSQTDCVIAAFTGTCGSLTPVAGACADNAANGGQETITFNGVGGTTYYFMVTTFSVGFALDNVTVTINGPTPVAVTLAAFTADVTGNGVALSWETVSEQDNAGFNVYRGETEAGPWLKLNDALIPAATPGSSEGHAYTWTDTTAEPGVTYWYMLEDIALDGTATQHPPVQVTVGEPNAVGLAGPFVMTASLAWPPGQAAVTPFVVTTLVVLAALAGAGLRRRG